MSEGRTYFVDFNGYRETSRTPALTMFVSNEPERGVVLGPHFTDDDESELVYAEPQDLRELAAAALELANECERQRQALDRAGWML